MFIEVKGRVLGADDVTVSRNQLLTALNKPDNFTLAIVAVATDDSTEVRYLQGPYRQAAEKAIKALAIVAQIEFPFVHDLPRLTAVLPATVRPSSPEADLDWLTRRATAWRYPADVEADWPDAERSVAIAGAVVADARASLRSA